VQQGCPWFAFRDPFVQRVLESYPWFESGQINTWVPHASHRLIQGLGFYHRALNLCQAKNLELEIEANRKKS